MTYQFSDALNERIQSLTEIQYTLLENDIHHIHVLKGSRKAVDEMFDLILDLHDARIDKRQRLKLFTTAELDQDLPINRVIARTREDKPKWGITSYGANIVVNKTLSVIIVRMLQTLGLGSPKDTRFFGMDERDEAIEWLKSCPEFE